MLFVIKRTEYMYMKANQHVSETVGLNIYLLTEITIYLR